MKAFIYMLGFLFVSVSGQNRAAPVGADCWYPSHICAYGVSDGVISQSSIDTSVITTIEDRTEDCYNQCNTDAGGSCSDFTLFETPRSSTCFLLSQCTVDSEAICIEQGKCFSGPSDCTVADPNAPCPQILAANTAAGNIHWQCTDGDGQYVNGYAGEMEAGTTCMLRCESWEAKDGSDSYLYSECKADGSWSQTFPSMYQTSGDEEELGFPSFPDTGAYPKPDEEQKYECGCKDLNVMWPLVAGTTTPDTGAWSYNPSDEKGTDFVCEQPIDTMTGEYVITTDNSCILFCDSYLVADVRCLNGEWTGQPELGFWCYEEPQPENALTPSPDDTTVAQ